MTGARAAVSLGNPAVMRYGVKGQSFQVVGIPLPEAGATVAYYEANNLDDSNDTRDARRRALGCAAGRTTRAGVVLGIWASYRAAYRNVEHWTLIAFEPSG